MNQIIHILRKDLRRHWIEILASLAVLAMYTWHAPEQWTPGQHALGFGGSSVFFLFLSGLASTLSEMLPVLLMASWCFLIVRVVHSEKLVGDRLFWVTRPYEWKKLLTAKLLFLVVCVNVPLFVAQLELLGKAGFLSPADVWKLVGMQIGIASMLILTAFTLAVVSSGLGQAVLIVVGLFVAFSAILSLYSSIPNYEMTSTPEPWSRMETLLEMLIPVVVILLQYSRRRTWQSRSFLLLSAIAFLIVEAVTPYVVHVERKYPALSAAQPAPVRLDFLPLVNAAKKLAPEGDWGGQEFIHIPLKVAGVADSSVIQIVGTRIKIMDGADVVFDPGWKRSWQSLWPTTETTTVDFRLDKKLFDRIKATPVTVDISIASNEFRESSPREVLLQEGEFAVPGLGICRLSDPPSASLLCRLPKQGPALMARATLSRVACQEHQAQSTGSTVVGRALDPLRDYGFATPRLDPVEISTISPGTEGGGTTLVLASARGQLRLCPGSSIHLATPVEAGRFRIEIRTGPIILADYTLRQFPAD
jgi:hypothetical protein